MDKKNSTLFVRMACSSQVPDETERGDRERERDILLGPCNTGVFPVKQDARAIPAVFSSLHNRQPRKDVQWRGQRLTAHPLFFWLILREQVRVLSHHISLAILREKERDETLEFKFEQSAEEKEH